MIVIIVIVIMYIGIIITIVVVIIIIQVIVIIVVVLTPLSTVVDHVDPDDLGLAGQHVHLHLRHCGSVHVVPEDVLVRLPGAAHRSSELGEAAAVGVISGAAHTHTHTHTQTHS